jgi:hypothetical protein
MKKMWDIRETAKEKEGYRRSSKASLSSIAQQKWRTDGETHRRREGGRRSCGLVLERLPRERDDP